MAIYVMRERKCFSPVLDPPTCIECREGFLVLRRGKYGNFYGCSTFPKCTYACSENDGNEAYDGPSSCCDSGDTYWDGHDF